MGRKRLYFSDEELKEAKNEYAKKYYAENPNYWRDRYDGDKARATRDKNMKKGYFIIYNDELKKKYVSFSKNIQERQRVIRQNIKHQITPQSKKFSVEYEWKWKMLFFCDEECPDLLEKCEYKEKEYINL